MKLIQLNIEHEKHLERVVPFLAREQADIACLEEVRERDLPIFEDILRAPSLFAPMTRYRKEPDGAAEPQGIALFTRHALKDVKVMYYFGGEGELPLHQENDRDSVWQPLITATVLHRGEPLVVGVTHFMKSMHGLPDDYQRSRLPKLLALLETYPEMVLCGDFNVPRDTELYASLAARYRDRVPRTYTSSIDPSLHRVPGLAFMIDYIWSTAGYEVRDVRMECGLSDHCALIGEVYHSGHVT